MDVRLTHTRGTLRQPMCVCALEDWGVGLVGDAGVPLECVLVSLVSIWIVWLALYNNVCYESLERIQRSTDYTVSF